MPISQKIRDMIRSAWDDGSPCLVATQGPDGPNISPKGSMVVFDDEHLAYWERSKKQALANLGHDKRVCVMYANFKAQRDGVLESGFLRFWGTAEMHESGPIREAIFKLLLPREQTHVGADTGIGYLIWNSWQLFNINRMFAGLLVLAALGHLSTLALDELQHRFVPWRL